jgi:hypothetical protein
VIASDATTRRRFISEEIVQPVMPTESVSPFGCTRFQETTGATTEESPMAPAMTVSVCAPAGNARMHRRNAGVPRRLMPV